ncbi:serine hydrolase [Geothrix sp. 21YS21S-4]|uniref:serine hydrolase domain-containing protein n=1 Tax=Geothrix sp. 21YS21S-4 TaxID=3068889 RepID=UPI0027B955ED|nr:serine hydrolase domain-containing protein [Geothrix sp. 21YS21S-4]
MRLFACLLACLLPLTAAAPEDAVDALVRRHMAHAHIPGAAVAILRNGRIDKLAAYGTASLESGSPVTPDSPFQIASSTKLFTGVLLMQLVEAGQMKLNAPVSAYLGEVPSAWRSITVRQLAAHASGLKPTMLEGAQPSLAQAVKATLAQPLASAPGAVSAYGSDDFSVLALILEKVGGRPFPDLLRERIWKPLGRAGSLFEDASETGLARTAEVIPGRVRVYQWQGERQRLHWFRYPPHTYAAGGAFASLRDMAAFLLAVDQGKLLGAARADLWTPFRLNDGRPADFGVAWTVGTLAGWPCTGHSGGPALADVIYLPKERLGVIVLTNQQRLAPTLARAIAAQLVEPGPLATEPAPADPDPALTARHAALVEALARGRAEAAGFSGEALVALPEAARELDLRLFPYGALQRVTFRGERPDGGRRVRTYRALHNSSVVVTWTFTLDAQGRVADFDLKEE